MFLPSFLWMMQHVAAPSSRQNCCLMGPQQASSRDFLKMAAGALVKAVCRRQPHDAPLGCGCIGLLQKKGQDGTQTTMEATLTSQQTPGQREQVSFQRPFPVSNL